MKKIVYCFICIILLFAVVSCSSITEMQSGWYVASGDIDSPYLQINSEDSTFSLSQGFSFSYAANGNYEIKNNKIFATSGDITYIFEIEDEKTVVLKDVGKNDYFKNLINLKFEFADFQKDK